MVEEHGETQNLEQEERTDCYFRENRKESVDQLSTGGLWKMVLNCLMGTDNLRLLQNLHCVM